jgi:ADP-heptose:LPS heptosyltransferase
MRIALLRLSALGDILRVLPAWADLREAFPGARFQAVVEDRHAFLLQPLPWLEPVLVARRALGRPWEALGELRRAAAAIRGCEASLDFHGILKSALIPRLAGIGERWGDGVTREGAGLLQTRRLPFRRQSRYGQALGLAAAFCAGRGRPGEGGRFRAVLKETPLPDPGPVWEPGDRPRVVLVPGASRRGAVKRWPLEHWQELARRLQGRCQMRWSLGPEEAGLRAWLPQASRVPALPETDLWTLAAALRQADRVVAADTGLLHLAVALGVPVLGLYGGSDPVVAGIPDGTGKILRTGIECSPCRERGCQRMDCLVQLTPERVLGEF